jgi:hypothetical protein
MLIKPNYKILFYISVGIIILLFIWILKDFIWNFFSNLKFHAFPEKFSWFDVFTLVFGSIWTGFVFYISWRFNKNTEVQNQLAFEADRPVLVYEKPFKIKNIGTFDAWNIKTFRIDSKGYEVLDGFSDTILNIGNHIGFDPKTDDDICSILIIYENLASNIKYIQGFDLNINDENSYNFNSINKTELNFKKLLTETTIKKQILEKVDVDKKVHSKLEDVKNSL